MKVVPLRGNLDTRLHKLRQGEVDAIIVAEAGLLRMGLSGIKYERLPYCVMLPAPGQGALGCEVRRGELESVVARINDHKSWIETQAERALLQRLRGGSRTPIGALARAGSDGSLYLEAMVCYPDGRNRLRFFATGSANEPIELGKYVADELLKAGADRIIATLEGRDV